MSHFLLYALMSKGKIENASNSLKRLMEPYSEHLEVQLYQEECYCKKHQVILKARTKLEKEMGTLDAWRENYKSENGMEWSKYIEPFTKRQDELIQELMPFIKPAHDCEQCRGNGYYKSNYNKQTKWDWYVIGGRWDGVFSEDKKRPAQTDPYEDNLHGNILRISDIKPDHVYPFALLSPMGWHERGKMLMFGESIDNKEGEVWEEEVQAVYNKYPDHYVVAIDCHI